MLFTADSFFSSLFYENFSKIIIPYLPFQALSGWPAGPALAGKRGTAGAISAR
jgi:hypothetical protein